MAGVEAAIERSVCQQAVHKFGVPNIKLGQDGWPDRQFLIPGGQPFFIEFKAPGGKLSARQVARVKWLRSAGYQVEVHDETATALRSIARAVEAARLSKEGHQVPARERLRRPVPGPGAGQDLHHVGRHQDSIGQRADAQGADYRPASRVPQRVAKGDREVARLFQAPNRGAARKR